MTLQPVERRAALHPGLLPDRSAGVDWPGLTELRERHTEAVAGARAAWAAVKVLEDRFKSEDKALREGTAKKVTPPAEREQALHPKRLAAEGATKRAEKVAGEVVAEVRERLPEWHGVLAEQAAERAAEREQLRGQLAELEDDDKHAARLEVWLKRADPEAITTGLYPWALLAAHPEPPARVRGPIERSFNPSEVPA
jgi:hypothetical protein